MYETVLAPDVARNFILWEVRNRYRLTSGTEPLISGTAGYCTFPPRFTPHVKTQLWPGDQKGVTTVATTAGFLWLKLTDESTVYYTHSVIPCSSQLSSSSYNLNPIVASICFLFYPGKRCKCLPSFLSLSKAFRPYTINSFHSSALTGGIFPLSFRGFFKVVVRKISADFLPVSQSGEVLSTQSSQEFVLVTVNSCLHCRMKMCNTVSSL